MSTNVRSAVGGGASCAVTAALGPEFANLRRSILRELVPDLEDRLRGVAEQDELAPVLAAFREDSRGLLDPRANGDLGMRAATVACEALATGRQTYLMPVLVSALTRMPVLLGGTPAQQVRLLADPTSGPRRGFAMTEPAVGSDVSGLSTVAAERGGQIVLNGHKRWISLLEEPEWIIVWTKPEGGSGHALSCVVVPGDAPGLQLIRHGTPLGMRAIPTYDLILEDVTIPVDNRIGDSGQAFGLAMRCLNAVRCLVAARGLGLTARVLMDATRYTRQRSAFGGTIADMQAVRMRLAELGARLEAARALTYRAAAITDEHRLGKQDAPVLAAAKYLATELAVDAATAALHLVGAAGYDEEEHGFARQLRDAQQLTIVEGVSEVQLELVGHGMLDGHLWWDD